MKTIVALVSGFGWHVSDLERAAHCLALEFQAVPFPAVAAWIQDGRQRIMAEDVELSRADGVLIRMMPPGSLEQVVFRMDALNRLAAAGVPVWNPPRAVEAAVDKYLSLALLVSAGLPVPTTWTGQSAAAALSAFEALGGDVVVKPLFGSEGRGLVRVSDPELAWRTFHTLERLDAVMYVQRMIRHPGHDLRVFVLQGRVLGAMRRFAAAGQWRTNVALGGRPEPCQLDREASELAVAAARTIGAELAGVDLVMDLDRDQYRILEVNAVPGWRALARVTGIDVSAAVLAGLSEVRR
jgi:ribosomal protein S6--L-glutamate ligase